MLDSPALVLALAYLCCALVWGTTWYAIRASTGADGLPVYGSAAARFVLAAAVLGGAYLLGAARPGPTTRREVGWLVAAGLCNGASYAFVYRAEQDVSGGVAAVVFGTMPLIAAAVAALTGTERARPAALAGAVVSLLGVIVLFADRARVAPEQGWAVLMLLGSVTLSSVYTTIVKRQAAAVNPFASAGVFLATTAVVLTLAAPLADSRPWPTPLPTVPLLCVVYLALFGSVLAFSSWFYLVRRVSIMTALSLVFVQPLIALAVDALLEPAGTLTPRTLLGAGIVLGGVLVGARGR